MPDVTLTDDEIEAREKAATPGPWYPFSGHAWSALGVAIVAGVENGNA